MFLSVPKWYESPSPFSATIKIGNNVINVRECSGLCPGNHCKRLFVLELLFKNTDHSCLLPIFYLTRAKHVEEVNDCVIHSEPLFEICDELNVLRFWKSTGSNAGLPCCFQILHSNHCRSICTSSWRHTENTTVYPKFDFRASSGFSNDGTFLKIHQSGTTTRFKFDSFFQFQHFPCICSDVPHSFHVISFRTRCVMSMDDFMTSFFKALWGTSLQILPLLSLVSACCLSSYNNLLLIFERITTCCSMWFPTRGGDRYDGKSVETLWQILETRHVFILSATCVLHIENVTKRCRTHPTNSHRLRLCCCILCIFGNVPQDVVNRRYGTAPSTLRQTVRAASESFPMHTLC